MPVALTQLIASILRPIFPAGRPFSPLYWQFLPLLTSHDSSIVLLVPLNSPPVDFCIFEVDETLSAFVDCIARITLSNITQFNWP